MTDTANDSHIAARFANNPIYRAIGDVRIPYGVAERDNRETTASGGRFAIRRGLVEACREFPRDAALAELLAFDPDDLFAGARDPAPGRDVRV